jgi:hypothetical protein
MSLFTILATTDWGVVSAHIRDHYIENVDEKRRRERAQLRDDFYEGKGDAEIEKLIDLAFEDAETKKLREVLIRFAKWNNRIARLVREKSTVYSQPAARKIVGDNETYQKFLELIQLDDAMRELNRKLTLHEDMLVMYRVRELPDGTREPVVDVIQPGAFWAIAHPNDRTMLVGIIIDQRIPTAASTAPAYRVWTHDETFLLDGGCRYVENSAEVWPIGRIPGVLATTRKPGTKPTLLVDDVNADLVAMQSAGWFEDLLLLKESKSANKQAYVSGDTSNATMGQTADTERDVLVGEGVNVQAIDRGMDLKQFRDTSMFIGDVTAENHGIPSSVMHQTTASSGMEVALRMIPIEKIRLEQVPVMRRTELAVHTVIAAVNAVDLTDYAFKMDGWSVDFKEVQQPLTETERDAVFDERRRLMLTDNLEEEMRRNPDIKTLDEAKKVIEARVARQTEVVKLTKELSALNGSMGSAPGDPTAAQNGATGPATTAAVAKGYASDAVAAKQ